MPRGTIDWKSPDSYTRLLAAMVAAQDMKLNYKKIADMYGEGATYDSIEGRFRIIKKEAAKLKEEIENGTRPEAPARGKTVSPRKAHPQSGDAKSANSTPTKKRTAAQMKKELYESSTSSSANGDAPSFPVSENGGYMNDSFASYDPSVTLSFDLTSADQFMMGGWNDDSVA
ncbi:hypothetical protein FH972_022381 [Carpinus fangiana]|uniref:Uncharacterized protein n=1 Tax=Carpinus fangiana TaxID=176857 RepID=A0A5N6KUB5_9ROSI|nr:hypothetical protein FH972_022381 [Carpinus fangiana]